MRQFFGFLLFWLFIGTKVFSLDYFEIKNPKFHPIGIGIHVQPETDIEAGFLQGVLQNNLEQTLYFSLLPIAWNDVLKGINETLLYHLQIRFQSSPVKQVEMSLREIKSQKILLTKSTQIPHKKVIRKIGLQWSDQIIETTLQIPGLSTSQIAYVAKSPQTSKNIRIVSFDGTQDERFSYNLGSNNLPTWSFDNKYLMYTIFTSTASQIAIQPVHRPQARLLSFPLGVQPLSGSWSPDGSNILLTLMKHGNADIYRYDLSTDAIEQLTQWVSLETSPIWSANGKMIAFVSDKKKFQFPQIYVHDFERQTTTHLPLKLRYVSAPKWSPDGENLLFEGKKGSFFQIFKYNLVTKKQQQLTFGAFHAGKPDWSPNGQQFVFSARKKRVPKIYYMSAYGGRMVRVTANPDSVTETSPVWNK